MSETRTRRCAILRITPEILIEMAKPGKHWTRTIKGLPEDAKIRGVGKWDNWWYSPDYASICLVVESESFAEVEEGHVLPECDPVHIQSWDGKGEPPC